MKFYYWTKYYLSILRVEFHRILMSIVIPLFSSPTIILYASCNLLDFLIILTVCLIFDIIVLSLSVFYYGSSYEFDYYEIYSSS